jgi:hypothetical protein
LIDQKNSRNGFQEAVRNLDGGRKRSTTGWIHRAVAEDPMLSPHDDSMSVIADFVKLTK